MSWALVDYYQQQRAIDAYNEGTVRGDWPVRICKYCGNPFKDTAYRYSGHRCKAAQCQKEHNNLMSRERKAKRKQALKEFEERAFADVGVETTIWIAKHVSSLVMEDE